MKTIVVPTDFSANAQKALNFAVNIANHFGAEIRLFHSYTVHSRAGMMVSVRDFIRKDAEEALGAEVKRIKNRLLHDAKIKATALEGSTVEIICAYAKDLEADLIVMGTKGASGLEKVLFGSIAAGVIGNAEGPVLAIPEHAVYKPFKRITLALETSDLSRELLSPLLYLSKAYQSKLKIIHVEKEPALAGADNTWDIYFSDTHFSFHTIVNEDVIKGINHFVQLNATDLLVLIHEERSIFKNLFHKSISKEKAMSSSIPLLVLHAPLP